MSHRATRRRAQRAILWIVSAAAFAALSSCAGTPGRLNSAPTGTPRISQPFEDEDVEAGPPITPRTVSETMMLHRNVRAEAYAGMYMPSGELEVGPMAGVRGDIEAAKNVFWGVSFDWGNQTIGDLPAGSITEPEQHYEEIDRYNFLVNLAYDWVLVRELWREDAPLSLRLGLGVGGSLIRGPTQESLRLSPGGVKVMDYWGLLVRPALDLHWRVTPQARVLFGAGFDFLYPDWIQERRAGKVYDVEGSVAFSTFFVRAGFFLEF